MTITNHSMTSKNHFTTSITPFTTTVKFLVCFSSTKFFSKEEVYLLKKSVVKIQTGKSRKIQLKKDS